MAAYIIIVLCALCVAALLYAERQNLLPVKWIAKTAASLSFVLLAVVSGGIETDYGRMVTLGLVLCLMGDLFLIPKSKAMFLAGMGAFAAGHLAYVAAFAGISGGISTFSAIAALAIGISFGGVLKWLWPHLAEFRIPVAAYCIIIGAMCVMSFTTASPSGSIPYWPAIIGAIGFAISDISVARDQFVTPEFFNRAWGLPLYYGSQLVLAASVSL